MKKEGTKFRRFFSFFFLLSFLLFSFTFFSLFLFFLLFICRFVPERPTSPFLILALDWPSAGYTLPTRFCFVFSFPFFCLLLPSFYPLSVLILLNDLKLCDWRIIDLEVYWCAGAGVEVYGLYWSDWNGDSSGNILRPVFIWSNGVVTSGSSSLDVVTAKGSGWANPVKWRLSWMPETVC